MKAINDITNKIFLGDARSVLHTFPSECVDMCITSPPFYNQRSYGGLEFEIGSEKSVGEYLNQIGNVFDEVKRVLKPTGTCWVNIGDKYHNGELYGVPERFVVHMMLKEWRRFNTIIWRKPNTFTGSSKKRFNQDFEYLYAFSKNDSYYFDQQYEPYKTLYKSFDYTGKAKKNYKSDGAQDPSDAKRSILRSMATGKGRIKRCVWSIVHGSSAHTASFPRDLVHSPILAGTPLGGLVLDPFVGSGTSLRVASECGRRYVGIDLNPKSVEMAQRLVDISC
ncbi:MAG TPA: site-specific DNA-methyltransferase [Smithellaceae bacterium]|nr:site-specific DNA-methyltransferase [Smithellaceae bacterium]